jgi:hypothetical protein
LGIIIVFYELFASIQRRILEKNMVWYLTDCFNVIKLYALAVKASEVPLFLDFGVDVRQNVRLEMTT